MRFEKTGIRALQESGLVPFGGQAFPLVAARCVGFGFTVRDFGLKRCHFYRLSG